jgi:putative ABC transport system permease protein
VTPPKTYQKLFRWICNGDFYEELQGDLEERYYINVQRLGQRKAKSIYKTEVLKMIRPSVIKKSKTHYQLNNIAMFRNYTKIAFRTISRNKLFSSINIIGLAISMAVGLLAITFLQEIYSYDEFHENADRIYRVTSTLHEGDEPPAYYASTPVLLGKILKADYAGNEKFVTIYRNFSGDVKKGDNTVPIKGLLADEGFFDVFSFPLLYGDATTALKNPFSIVLTEETALKIFGKKDVVGEVVDWDGKVQITVTGVAKSLPRKSHIQFEAVGSFSTFILMNKANKSFMTWENMWNSHVYLLASEENNTTALQANLNQISKSENEKLDYMDVDLELQSLQSIFPGDTYYNEIGARMDLKTVRSIVILALIVLISACFNYTNLSIARTLKRSKEVGVRKVIGAKRSQLILQFIFESVVISMLALLFAYLIFNILKPEFIALNRNISRSITLDLSLLTYGYFFFFSVVIGLIAGFIPSLILSKLNITKTLKGISGIKGGNGFNIRKVLIGLQFTLSMAFAIMVTLTYNQYQYVLNFDLGFESENILNVNLQGNDAQILTSSFSQLTGVSQISASSSVPSIGGMWKDQGKYIEGNDSTMIYNLHISSGYLDNLGHKILAGADFSDTKSGNEIIINEQLLKKFGFIDANEAIGKQIRMQRKTRNIVAVVKDFHYGTLDNNIEPFAFLNDPESFRVLNLKLGTKDYTSLLTELENKWSEIDPSHEFNAVFYNDRIERAYSDISSSMKTLGLLSIIAISISMLGLLGMAVYTTETRIKELTIRKVLGANSANLLSLLSKSYLILFLIAACIAIPLTFYGFKEMIIADLKYTIDIGVVELGSGALIVLAIAIITISSQAIKAIKSNPVKHLRNE